MSKYQSKYSKEFQKDDYKNKKAKKEPMFDFLTILRYAALTILFSVIIYGMRLIVLAATAASPTNQVGNGILTLYEVHNTGAAFSLFQNYSEMIIMSSFLAVIVLVLLAVVLSAKLTQAALSAMSLLTSGIIMNMVERLTQGYVIDYIHFEFWPSFPVFNTADIMIVFGALGLIWSIVTKR